jgi:hypothetical protein
MTWWVLQIEAMGSTTAPFWNHPPWRMPSIEHAACQNKVIPVYWLVLARIWPNDGL